LSGFRLRRKTLNQAVQRQKTHQQARASNASQLTGRQVIKHPIAKKTMMAPSPAKFAAQSRATKLDSIIQKDLIILKIA